ncbi:MAG: insulinase family protein [Myxococcota bacterium]
MHQRAHHHPPAAGALSRHRLLREEKGYTYGAGSQVSFRNSVGVFVAYAALQRVFSAPGLKEFFVELTDLETKPLSDEEIERVRTGLVRSLPGDFEGIGNLAGAAAQIFAYDLPLDHYARLAARIESTTADEVRAAADAFLDPGVMQVLMVGDAKTVVPALEGLGFSPITRVEP